MSTRLNVARDSQVKVEDVELLAILYCFYVTVLTQTHSLCGIGDLFTQIFLCNFIFAIIQDSTAICLNNSI